VFKTDAQSKELSARYDAIWLAVQSPFGALDWGPYLGVAQKACGEKPEAGSLRESLGASLFRAERFSEARPEFEKAITLSGGGTWSMHIFLAMTYARLNQAQKAFEHFKIAEQRFAALKSPDWEERLRHRLLEPEAQQLLEAIRRQPLRAERPAPPSKQPVTDRRPKP
jgi:tetratricopeptide (TPR) repeat protein